MKGNTTMFGDHSGMGLGFPRFSMNQSATGATLRSRRRSGTTLVAEKLHALQAMKAAAEARAAAKAASKAIPAAVRQPAPAARSTRPLVVAARFSRLALAGAL